MQKSHTLLDRPNQIGQSRTETDHTTRRTGSRSERSRLAAELKIAESETKTHVVVRPPGTGRPTGTAEKHSKDLRRPGYHTPSPDHQNPAELKTSAGDTTGVVRSHRVTR